jgi:hypothetical protein
VEHSFDSEILSRTGFSEDDARDFIRKHQAYLNSLSPAQYTAVQNTLPSWEDAAKAIDPKMTAADLQDFVARRGEKPVASSALCFAFPYRPPK